MPDRFPKPLLRQLRNDIPIDRLIQNGLNIPAKIRDGHLRFLCPRCRDFITATNPKTNLARCFQCKINFNPIDLVMAEKGYPFVEAVHFLLNWL